MPSFLEKPVDLFNVSLIKSADKLRSNSTLEDLLV